MSSNILSVVNPPPQRDLDNEETKDCIPCQIMSTMFSIGFGAYLVSGKPFEYTEVERRRGVTMAEFEKRNPKWWKGSLRGLGGTLIILGFVRGTEGWLWNKEKEYKKF
ncbi:hypothetical protein Kpol_530p42 [Vanderwaltozyma polyspora DSM 70294]|uniref:DUF4536 domain-containing protein n=1 Tax=Vanderwaltozyma polyspora (strain ATCC 22028 / DSM 70294 / BCRC 21397 / CBS 2163 / NBRC 10782 / NRRL Y-8283 / UCD 57-17) TaxID=436907 RepID=A7TL16_VANPO|nr:uncharacterized protein Kpol_530p42 [Vanderwaltozyma polyspora DSM 70294]EDO17072.1 hypothetical protein Kpol_530p42 [Vanderwaltozyma polyspora DSM 70294]